MMTITCQGDDTPKKVEERIVHNLKDHLSDGLISVNFVDELPGDFCGAYFPPGFIFIDRYSEQKFNEPIAKVLCHEVGHHEYFKLSPETKNILDKAGINNEIFAQLYEVNWPRCYK